MIRADASPAIGAGHVMRCLAIAQAWRRAGGAVALASYQLPAALRARVLAEGVELLDVEPDGAAAADAAQEWRAAWVVLDGYLYGVQFTQQLMDAVPRLLRVDDNGESVAPPATMLLNGNLHASAAMYPSGRFEVLAGPAYALLRDEFREHCGRPRVARDPAQNVLITFGGSDPLGLTDRAYVSLLRAQAGRGLCVQIIRGGAERAATDDAPGESRVSVVRAATDMAARMAWADVAITAAGVTSTELLAVGTPAIQVITADNQRRIAAAMQQAGASILLGEARDVTADSFVGPLLALLDDAPRRQRMIDAGRQLVDGRGPDRVVAAMLAHLSGRPASTTP
ncbi:MAG: UDP-2,4-diacetamido-2,4,6-trideoxy-beta-L-altropyranose hydrolase [Planctomycetota bacterium]